MAFSLGNTIRDNVTGFTGIAVARCEYLNGCVHYGICPKVGADGKVPDTVYFDHQRIEFVDDGVVVKRRDTGGPQRDAPRS